MSFITSLVNGDFKVLRPPMSLINYQIDQNRPWIYKKEYIASAETEVSAESIHDSIQWDDIKSVFFDESGFQPGFICGLSFSMNSYTKAQRDFTAGHIAVVAKLDIERSLYKYVVYEKEFGVFGLMDEESLEQVIRAIMALYSGMNYSRVKLRKYGEATDKTYALLNSLIPLHSAELSPVVHVNRYAGSIFSTPKKETIVSLEESTVVPGRPRAI